MFDIAFLHFNVFLAAGGSYLTHCALFWNDLVDAAVESKTN